MILSGQDDVEVVGEVESHPVVGDPEATMGMWPPAVAGVVPPTSQSVVSVHLLSLSGSESGAVVHGQTLTLDSVLHI